jgi:hypothetical protein
MYCEINVQEGNADIPNPLCCCIMHFSQPPIPPVLRQEEAEHVTRRMHILESEKPIHQAPGLTQ